MNRLEERYRSVLRILPAGYRAAWEEDMVATFLEGVETEDPEYAEYTADYGRPHWSEVASIASLAVRLRLGGVGAPPRYFAWGEAVRLVALIALLGRAVMAAAYTGIMVWLTGRITWLPAPRPEWTVAAFSDSWQLAWHALGSLWIPAYLALVFGHRRAAQLLALLAIVPTVVYTGGDLVASDGPGFVVAHWSGLLVDALLVLAMASFHRDSPPVRRRPWLVALPVGIALVPAPLFAVAAADERAALLDWPGLSCVVLIAAVSVHLAMVALGRARRTTSWSLALTLLVLTALGLRVVTLLDYARFAPPADRPSMAILGIVETVALLVVGVPEARLAVTSLRRLPPAPVGTGPSTPTP